MHLMRQEISFCASKSHVSNHRYKSTFMQLVADFMAALVTSSWYSLAFWLFKSNDIWILALQFHFSLCQWKYTSDFNDVLKWSWRFFAKVCFVTCRKCLVYMKYYSCIGYQFVWTINVFKWWGKHFNFCYLDN